MSDRYLLSDGCILNMSEEVLSCCGHEVHLRPMCWTLLVALVEAQGKLLTYSDALKIIEDPNIMVPDGLQVTDSRVADTISEIRKILKENSINVKVNNKSKRGYFLSPVPVPIDPPALVSDAGIKAATILSHEDTTRYPNTLEATQASRPTEADKIGILEIVKDSTYKDGETIVLSCGTEEFFLVPPIEKLSQEEQSLVSTLSFSEKMQILDEQTLKDIGNRIGLLDLSERINKHREKVLQDFVSQANGTYFNNKKLGTYFLNIFQRTEDIKEKPKLTIRLFWTDYYTHRVMKSLFHELRKERHPCLELIYDCKNYIGKPSFSIFLTSLGINIIVEGYTKDGQEGMILTQRAPTATETGGKVEDSISAIEGVALVHHDSDTESIHLTDVVYDALESELGISRAEIAEKSIEFHELFLTKEHGELNLTCTVKLKDHVYITKELLNRDAKDKSLEVANEFFSTPNALRKNLSEHIASWKPQAAYTALCWLQRKGY